MVEWRLLLDDVRNARVCSVPATTKSSAAVSRRLSLIEDSSRAIMSVSKEVVSSLEILGLCRHWLINCLGQQVIVMLDMIISVLNVWGKSGLSVELSRH